jgi:hypothetical protein
LYSEEDGRRCDKLEISQPEHSNSVLVVVVAVDLPENSFETESVVEIVAEAGVDTSCDSAGEDTALVILIEEDTVDNTVVVDHTSFQAEHTAVAEEKVVECIEVGWLEGIVPERVERIEEWV